MLFSHENSTVKPKKKRKPLVFQRSPGLQGPHVGTSWMDVRWWNQITTTLAVPLYWLVHRGPYSGAGFHPLFTANNQGPLVDNSFVRSRDFCVNRGPDRKRFMISFRSCGSILASDEDEAGVIATKVWLWWIPSLYKRWFYSHENGTLKMKTELWNEKEDHLPNLHFRSSMLVFGSVQHVNFTPFGDLLPYAHIFPGCRLSFFSIYDWATLALILCGFCRCENLLIQAICWYNMNFICILYIYIYV